MIRIFLLTIFVWSFATLSHAQTLERVLVGSSHSLSTVGDYSDAVIGTKPISDGYIIAGYAQGPLLNLRGEEYTIDQEYYIARLDNNMDVVWFESLDHSDYSAMGAFTVSSSEDIYLALSGTRSIQLMKYSSDGVYQWTKVLQDIDVALPMLFDIEVNPEGIVYIAGETGQLAKLYSYNENTDEIKGFEVPFEEINGSHWVFFQSMEIDNMGNLIVLGNSVDTGGGSINIDGDIVSIPCLDPESFWCYENMVLKLNSNLDLIWYKTFGGVTKDYGTAMALNDAGEIGIVGNFQKSFDIAQESFAGNLKDDIYFVKLDPDGEFQWFRSMNNEFQNSATTITFMDDHWYVGGSLSENSTYWNGAETTSLENNRASYIFNFDNSGELISSIELKNVNSTIYDLSTKNGNLLISGSITYLHGQPAVVNSLYAVDHRYSLFLFKITSPIVTGFEYVDNDELSLYPNPAHSIIHLEANRDDLSLILINSNGQKVFETRLEAGNNKIDISRFHQGIYYLQIVGKETIETRRIVFNDGMR